MRRGCPLSSRLGGLGEHRKPPPSAIWDGALAEKRIWSILTLKYGISCLLPTAIWRNESSHITAIKSCLPFHCTIVENVSSLEKYWGAFESPLSCPQELGPYHSTTEPTHVRPSAAGQEWRSASAIQCHSTGSSSSSNGSNQWWAID